MLVFLWSNGPEFLATDPEIRVRFPTIPDLLRNNGYGKGSIQLRSYLKEKVTAAV
jgi:hypothetical protein